MELLNFLKLTFSNGFFNQAYEPRYVIAVFVQVLATQFINGCISFDAMSVQQSVVKIEETADQIASYSACSDQPDFITKSTSD